MGVKIASASCSYIFITAVSSSSQENSSMVKKESHVPQVLFFCLSPGFLPFLHGLITKNAISVHSWALLGEGAGQSRGGDAALAVTPGQPWGSLL